MHARGLKILYTSGTIMILLVLVGVTIVAAQAEVYDSVVTVPLEYYSWETCAGEGILWTGYVRFSVHSTRDNAGGLHAHIHVLAKIQGTGVETGIKYIENYNQRESIQLDSPGPWVFRYTVYARTIAQGKGPVLISRQVWLTTVSPTGEWSEVLEENKTYCEGQEPYPNP